MRQFKWTFLFVLSAVLSSPAQASLDGMSRVAAEAKFLNPPNGSILVYGWRFLHNSSDAFSIGGVAYTGQQTGETNASFSYGGISAAYNIVLTSRTYLEFGMMAGGGGGFRADNTQIGSLLIEPCFSFGFLLGKNVGSSLTAGYLWLPNAPTYSGASAGIRFEFFIDRVPRPVPQYSSRTLPEPSNQ